MMKLRRSAGGGRRGAVVRAVWNDTVLAESNRTLMVAGNHYLPPEDVNWELFEPSERRSSCPWKGEADYLTVVADGRRSENPAWR